MIKGALYQDITLPNIYSLNQRAPKNIKQLLKKHNHSRGSKYTVGGFQLQFAFSSILYWFQVYNKAI